MAGRKPVALFYWEDLPSVENGKVKINKKANGAFRKIKTSSVLIWFRNHFSETQKARTVL